MNPDIKVHSVDNLVSSPEWAWVIGKIFLSNKLYLLCAQEALQMYDTPRNVREAMETQAGLGNYAMPLPGALPVFR